MQILILFNSSLQNNIGSGTSFEICRAGTSYCKTGKDFKMSARSCTGPSPKRSHSPS